MNNTKPGSSIKGSNPIFAIHTPKRLFLGMYRQVTVDFKGMVFQNDL
jgi:hypothetical protein